MSETQKLHHLQTTSEGIPYYNLMANNLYSHIYTDDAPSSFESFVYRNIRKAYNPRNLTSKIKSILELIQVFNQTFNVISKAEPHTYDIWLINPIQNILYYISQEPNISINSADQCFYVHQHFIVNSHTALWGVSYVTPSADAFEKLQVFYQLTKELAPTNIRDQMKEPKTYTDWFYLEANGFINLVPGQRNTIEATLF